MDRLWGPCMMPDEIVLKTRRGWTRFDVLNQLQPSSFEPSEPGIDLLVRLQPHLSAFDKLALPSGEIPEIVVIEAELQSNTVPVNAGLVGLLQKVGMVCGGIG